MKFQSVNPISTKLAQSSAAAESPLRVVVCHNFYQQAGGEDRVFADETELLESHGHQVVKFVKHNDAVTVIKPWKLAIQTIWNRQVADELGQVVKEHRADVVHFHNTLPIVSPAAYYAARRAGAAVVQTLHNYRLVCPKGTFFRDGGPCEDCAGKLVPWPSVRHACYRDDRAATATIAAMLTFHRMLGTYQRNIDAYVALSHFALEKLASSGLPREKLHLKPNFMLEDPGHGKGAGGYALFLGRLSPEKGVETLLEAWQQHDPGVPLIICGDGPLAPLVEQACIRSNRITWYRSRPHAELLELLGDATIMVLPSLWYEGFPKTIVEAYSKGTPVVASRLGVMVELILDGKTGLHFTPGDAANLAMAVRRISGDEELLFRMRTATRNQFETWYSAEASYARMLEIYDQALRVRHGNAPPVATFANNEDSRRADYQELPALLTAR